MQYAKILNGEVVKFPYYIQEVKSDNPSVSFPTDIPEDILESYGCFRVYIGTPPADSILTHRILRADMPIFNGTRWEINYYSEPLPLEHASRNVRAERDMRLSTTDWVVTKSIESGSPIPTQYSEYRQALRDISLQEGFPWNISWPVLEV